MADNRKHGRSIRVAVNGQVEKLSFDRTFGLAYDLVTARRDDAATRLFQALTKAWPDDRPSQLFLAATHARLGQFAECLRRLEGIPGDDERIGAQLHPALVYAGIGMWEGATSELQDFLRLQPRWPGAWLLFGDTCLRTGRRHEAARAYQVAARMAENAPHVRACANRCARALNQSDSS